MVWMHFLLRSPLQRFVCAIFRYNCSSFCKTKWNTNWNYINNNNRNKYSGIYSIKKKRKSDEKHCVVESINRFCFRIEEFIEDEYMNVFCILSIECCWFNSDQQNNDKIAVFIECKLNQRKTMDMRHATILLRIWSIHILNRYSNHDNIIPLPTNIYKCHETMIFYCIYPFYSPESCIEINSLDHEMFLLWYICEVIKGHWFLQKSKYWPKIMKCFLITNIFFDKF